MDLQPKFRLGEGILPQSEAEEEASDQGNGMDPPCCINGL